MLAAKDIDGTQVLAWRAHPGVEYFCPECAQQEAPGAGSGSAPGRSYRFGTTATAGKSTSSFGPAHRQKAG